MSFSIVIPVHKRESCLTECLESVFQNLEGDEIVLVENGVSNNCWEVSINYSDTHPVKRRLKKCLKEFLHNECILSF